MLFLFKVMAAVASFSTANNDANSITLRPADSSNSQSSSSSSLGSIKRRCKAKLKMIISSDSNSDIGEKKYVLTPDCSDDEEELCNTGEVQAKENDLERKDIKEFQVCTKEGEIIKCVCQAYTSN